MAYGNRSAFRKIRESWLTLFVLLCAFAFTAKAAWSVYGRSSASADRLAEAQTALERLKARQGDLAAKVAYLSTDSGIESEIRAKFRAGQEGESVAVIVGDQDQASSTDISGAVKLSWWQKVLRIFGL